jgi:hypothetical protein
MYVFCPHCGGQVRVELGQVLVRCASCRQSFSSARPGYGPATPPFGAPVRPKPAGATLQMVVVLLVFVVPLLVGAAVMSVIWMRRRSTVAAAPPPLPINPGPNTPAPPPAPARPSAPSIEAPDMTRVEIVSLISQATTIARKVEERAVLTSLVAFKTTDGLADLTGEHFVSMRFDYLYTDPAKPPGADKVSG